LQTTLHRRPLRQRPGPQLDAVRRPPIDSIDVFPDTAASRP